MSAKNLNDAMKQCSESPSCHMFFYMRGAESLFGACEVTASMAGATNLAILYRKRGTKTNSLIVKDIL